MIPGGKAEPTITVRCSTCDNTRLITVSYKRRLDKEQRPAPCDLCALAGNATATDDYRWWWLERFGVERNGIPLAEHIERYGLPDELRELIGDLPPVVV